MFPYNVHIVQCCVKARSHRMRCVAVPHRKRHRNASGVNILSEVKLGYIFDPDIIYTTLCSMQRIYYIHVFLLFWAIMEFRGLNYETDPNRSTNLNRHSNRNTNPTLLDCCC